MMGFEVASKPGFSRMTLMDPRLGLYPNVLIGQHSGMTTGLDFGLNLRQTQTIRSAKILLKYRHYIVRKLLNRLKHFIIIFYIQIEHYVGNADRFELFYLMDDFFRRSVK